MAAPASSTPGHWLATESELADCSPAHSNFTEITSCPLLTPGGWHLLETVTAIIRSVQGLLERVSDLQPFNALTVLQVFGQ